MQQLWRNVSEDPEPVDEVNDAVLASSLAAVEGSRTVEL